MKREGRGAGAPTALALLWIAAMASATGPARAAATRPAPGPNPGRVVVYKTATCTCCGKWIEYLRGAGFQVDPQNIASAALVGAIRKVGFPDSLSSCHAALVGDYVVVGHVPARAVRRLLREHPRAVIGIAVGGMPLGSPGMEVEGAAAQSYTVMAVRKDGRVSVFERY